MKFASVTLFIIMMGSSCLATAYDDALVAAATAGYKQSGAEEMVNKYVEKKVPKKYRDLASKLLPVLNATINGRIEAKWTF